MGIAERQRLFKEWTNQYKGLFFKFVRAYAFDKHDEDDLFQEILLQVWRSIPNYKGQSKVSTWLYRIAINTSLSWTRKEKKRKTYYADVSFEPVLLENDDHDPRIDWLYEQITKFSEVDRSLVLLLLEGFSYREMANTLGISESNVGVKINRIKKKLLERSKELNHAI